MKTLRKANVLVRKIFAGTLSETDEGYTFTYDKQYIKSPEAAPVSLTLPIREEVYFSKILFPFFDGIIPEGWLLDIAVRNWKLSYNDRFGLLLAVCRDPIGNVSIEEAKQ